MKSEDQLTLDRVRAAARWRTAAFATLTMADVQAVLRMVMDGDLLHVDEVPAYVRRCQLEDYGTALVQSLRSAREDAA